MDKRLQNFKIKPQYIVKINIFCGTIYKEVSYLKTKLIVNADDFGYDNAVNYGIKDAHELGIITSTTIMPNMSGFDYAVELAKTMPNLGIGVHLTLTKGQSLCKHKYITDENGYFFSERLYVTNEIVLTYEVLGEIEQEWCEQIKRTKRAGIKITHIDSHNHMHIKLPELQEIAIRLAKENNCAMRTFEDLAIDVPHPKFFEQQFDSIYTLSKEKQLEYFRNLIKEIKKHEIVEIMTHPAYLSVAVYEGSSWNINRMYTNFFLIDSNFVDMVKNDNDIVLVTYADI